MTTSVRSKKAELIHIETDRRLGHEWDEWNGRPLPNLGNYSAPPGRFFLYALLTLGVSNGVLYALWFILAPRLASLWPPLSTALLLTFAAFSVISWTWFPLLAPSFYGRWLLPPHPLVHRPAPPLRRFQRHLLALVRPPGRFVLRTLAAAARTAGGAGAVPRADELDQPRGAALRRAGLGRARGGGRLQRARRAPRPEGRQGRAAGADPPLPVQDDAGRRAGSGGALRGPGVRGDA